MSSDPPAETIWMNGEFMDWEYARIHALSHVASYGTGVFEGSRAYETDDGPAVFRLDEHLDRLDDSASFLGVTMEHSTADLAEVTAELIRRNDLGDCYIRHRVDYGYNPESLGLVPEGVPVNTLVAAYPRETYLGEEALARGSDVKLSPWRRIHSSQFPTQAKANGIYIMAVRAKLDALQDGYDEAILLDAEGNVAEGSGMNLFLVDDGTIYTPGLDASILPGITRRSLIEVARDLGHEVMEKRITTGELYTADELFFCGTAAEVTPVRSVDGTVIGDGTRGSVTEELQEAFFEVVRGEYPEYEDWLTYV